MALTPSAAHQHRHVSPAIAATGEIGNGTLPDKAIDPHHPGSTFCTMSIAKKLLLVTLLIASVAVAAITALVWGASTTALHELESKRLADSVEREARILQTAFDMVKSDLSMLADGARHVTGEDSAPTLDGLQNIADQFDALMRERQSYRQTRMVLDAGAAGSPRVVVSARTDGVVRTIVDPVIAGWNYQTTLLEKQGLRSFNQQTRSLSDEPTGEKVLFTSVPIRGKDGTVVGAIALTVAMDPVFATLGGTLSNIAYWVADSAGHYLYQSRPETAVRYQHEPANAIHDFKLANSWDRLLSAAQAQPVVALPATAQLLAVRRVSLGNGRDGDSGNTVIVGGTTSLVDLETRAAALREQLTMVVLGLGLVMVLALCASTQRLLRPISDLTRVANRIASGDQDTVIPPNGDELGMITRAMMHMADELRAAGKNSEQSAMGQMALMIAHDLRNSLSSVKMNLQILDSHHRGEGDSQSENCDIALGQVRYMETILNDMLTFARPGTTALDWVDLGDTLGAASVSLLPEVTQKSIDLRMDGDVKLPTIMADRHKLMQLFQNLLSNAIHAVPEWGHITIRSRCLLHESKPAVEVRIEDDGPGISPQIADKVFEPFFTTSARGTGLGLAIVRRIVSEHGGQVCLDHSGNPGTTMIVLLPLTQGIGGNGDPADEKATPS